MPNNAEIRETPVAESAAETDREREAVPQKSGPAPSRPEAVSQPSVVQAESPTPRVEAAPAKDADTIRVERILEDNLREVYLELSPALRAKFRADGETAASKLRGMLGRPEMEERKILEIIHAWLKEIPGVDRQFLAQEEVIKTRKILALAA